MVTRPGLLGCFYCRWLPRVATRYQPSSSISLIASRIVIAIYYTPQVCPEPMMLALPAQERALLRVSPAKSAARGLFDTTVLVPVPESLIQ